MRGEISDRLQANLKRVRALVKVYQERSGTGRGRRSVEDTDTLRAAVVFLHAALEDMLRSLLEWRWPETPVREQLLEVPMIGHGRGRKFELADLVVHKGKSVDELIRQSVEAHLERSNFNSVAEVRLALERCWLAGNLVTPFAGDLAAFMSRRHQIVHRADRSDAPGSGHHAAASLGQATVTAWIDVVQRFCEAIVAGLDEGGS